MLKSVIHTLSQYTCVHMYITFYVMLETLENYMLAVKLSKHWVLYILILRNYSCSCENTNLNENMIIAVEIAINFKQLQINPQHIRDLNGIFWVN